MKKRGYCLFICMVLLVTIFIPMENVQAKAKPKLTIKNKTMYVGFPNYWSTMPMAVFTFLEHLDFSGKTIKPFCTHEGSGMGGSENDIKKLCPGAKLEKGLAIRGGSVEQSQEEIEAWI